MRVEDLSLMMQLISSMEEASKELEKSLEKKDIEKFKKANEEILNFQRQMAKLIG